MQHITRHDYVARRIALKTLLGTQDEEREVLRLYLDEGMSSIEISERFANAGIGLHPRSIQRIIKKNGLIRSVGDAFRLAAKRGRVKWAYKDKRFLTSKHQASPALRFKILQRDNYKCVLCGNTAEKTILEVDHIISKSNGGKDIESNLRTLCNSCNTGKRIVEKER